MKKFSVFKYVIYSLLLFLVLVMHQLLIAQGTPAALFETDEVLNVTLSGDIKELFNDRGDNASYHPLVLSYKGKDSTEHALKVKAKTRGHFRKDKANCMYPPVLLNFQNSDCASTLFQDQNKLKLVTSCRGEKYVIHEYLVYKLYSLLTPKSFRARLVRATFYDTIRKKETAFYCILLEDVQQMAKRNGLTVLNLKHMQAESTELETFLKMAVFQYMIGNTDWSIEYLHNIKPIAFDSLAIPYVVPYDFDHAGIVDAPYALPAKELELSSTRQRRYRGYCIADMSLYDKVIVTFNLLKADFYRVYITCPLLDAKYVVATLKFLDQFYETINTPKKVNAAFSYPCNKNIPKIIIGGLETSGTDN
jgi:hypothetical protein